MLNVYEITVITPDNDGESRTIIEICRKTGVDLRISDQPWGARLDREPRTNLENLREIVIVVEMPSVEAEEKLREKHRLIIIDHHNYPSLKLDRTQPLSSLEQIAQILNYKLNRREIGIAINDRAYIFGLLDAGYTLHEILQIRQFDLYAQGIPAKDIEEIRRAVLNAPVKARVRILCTNASNAGFAQDFLVLENPNEVQDLLILTGEPARKAQFYGDPQKIERISDLAEWMGGSGRSRFWGTNHPDVPEILRRLGIPNHEDHRDHKE